MKLAYMVEKKDIIKLIGDCDDLIKGLESDIRSVNTRKSRKKDKKGSTYNEEIRELIRDCDEVITSIEADLALARRDLKRTKRSIYIKEVRQNKEFKAECAELIQGIYLDISAIKLKYPFKQKEMLKRCDNLLKELENGLQMEIDISL